MDKASDLILRNMKSLQQEHGNFGIFNISEQWVPMAKMINHLETNDEIGKAFEDQICKSIINYFMEFSNK